MKAPVNRIIPFSNVDGPGNRMAIFLQKCPFKCLYCHNPETIKECIHCGICLKTCPTSALSLEDGKVIYKENLCCNCDTCIKTCPNLSSPKVKWMSVEEVVKEVKEVKDFIRGITVSGGECMEHAEFLLELFKEVKQLGLSCLIDSNGYFDFSEYPELLEVSDGVMLDVKASNPVFHKRITSIDNEAVLKNLIYLSEMNKLEEVRTVLLPNFPEQNRETVNFVSNHIPIATRYKLMRYRHYGVREEGVSLFGKIMISDEELDYLTKLAKEKGLVNVIPV